MRFVHPWMHRAENYWIHKRHHEGNRNCTLIHAFVFTALDLVLEFLVGAVIGMGFNKVVHGDASVHILALMFCQWTDGTAHSLNPYTQCIGNPVLDWFFKPNIAHTLHHAHQTDPRYMNLYRIEHLDPKERQRDIDLYNKILGTKVNFALFK